MKYFLLVSLLWISISGAGQIGKPASINLSYFGETITHPGIKAGVTYNLSTWNKSKIDLTPTVGFFYHKHYQTSLFLLPEISFAHYNKKGNYIAAGIGAGYMRSFIPNVYKIEDGEVKKTREGQHYFLSSLFFTVGKDVKVIKASIFDLYLKPQLLHAFASSKNNIFYFALEIGVHYKLR